MQKLENLDEIKKNLNDFLSNFKLIKIRTCNSMLEDIKSIDNVVSVVPDEFNEIYTINISNLFDIRLKFYKEIKKVKLGNFIYVGNKQYDYNEILGN